MKRLFSLLLVIALAFSMASSPLLAATQPDEVTSNAVDESIAETLISVAQAGLKVAKNAWQEAINAGLPQDKIDKANELLAKAKEAFVKAMEFVSKVTDSLSEEEKAKLKEDLKKLEQEIKNLIDQQAKVQPIDISNYEAILEKTTYQYTGKAITPAVKVTGLTESDYTVSYSDNVNVGTATVTITAKGDKYTGTIKKNFTITAESNTSNTTNTANTLAIKANPKVITVKFAKLKKKSQALKISKLIEIKDKGQGKLTYQIKSVKKGKKSFKKYFKINAGTGKVTVKKGLKKGTYKVTISVTAAGNDQYKKSVKSATAKIKVK
jgi:hypothetical protein